LQVTLADDPAKNKIQWKWSKGDAFGQAELGSPDATTSYALCIYDMAASVPSLAAEQEVPPGAFWRSKDPKGWTYVDKTLANDGVQQLVIGAGAATKTKARVTARGAGVNMPAPFLPTKMFAADPGIVVQLLSSEGACWSSELATPDRNDGERYKAKFP
jgi:hypothetical protein